MSDDASWVVPIVTVMELASVAMPVAICPGATTGLVSPNPVPYSATISPGCAGDAPATTLGSATTDPLTACSAAMLVEFGKTKNAGANACSVLMVATALFTPPDPGFRVTVSVTGASPGVPGNTGICALIWP